MLQDVQFALRQFRKRPLWTLVIVVVLALGIGANTAMFTAFDAWVLRPLDFHEPERLVALKESQPALGRLEISVSPRNLSDWIERGRSFEAVGAYSRRRFNLSDDAEPARVDGTRVSATLFPTLGRQPILGRGFSAEDDRPGSPAAVALISHQLWERRFDADPGIVGQTVRLDGAAHEIIGVMEPGFKFPEFAEVWTPLGLDMLGGDRGEHWLGVIARLRSGETIETAGAEMRAVASELEQQYPETNSGWSANVMPVRDEWVPDVITTALTASLASGILVLLVVCANVASLILAQSTARMRETAVRTAIGANRWRLVRQSLTEGILLALLAGVLGAGVAVLGVSWMLSWVPLDPPYLFAMGGLNLNGALYTLAVAMLAGVACGLVPVLQSSGRNVVDVLRSGRASSGTRGTRRFGRALVMGELALSTALLIAALLVVKSFLALQSVNRGYRTDGVMTATLELSGDGLDETSARLAAVDRVLASLGQLDGVETVGVTTDLPAGTGPRSWSLIAEGRVYQPGEDVDATVQAIAGDYLTTLGIPIVDGRTFTDSEKRDGGQVALVSESLATELWGAGDPLERQLRRVSADDNEWLRVVGVVGDVDYGRDLTSVGTVPEAQLYVPYGGSPTPEIIAVGMVVGGRSPQDLAGPARRALATSVPGIPVEAVDLETVLFRVQWVSRFFGNQLAFYALLASVIAALGLYGLMSHAAGSRRHELAVRMALGARPADLIRLILGDAVLLAGAGIGAGLLLAFGVTRFGAAMLPGVSARDPIVFGGVATLLALVALTASFLPARRATLLDPNEALRAE